MFTYSADAEGRASRSPRRRPARRPLGGAGQAGAASEAKCFGKQGDDLLERAEDRRDPP